MKVDLTMRLRWVELSEKEENTACVAMKEYITYFYKLQQYWQNDNGKGEWIDVPIERNPNNYE